MVLEERAGAVLHHIVLRHMPHPNDWPPSVLAGIGAFPVCLAAFVPYYHPESFWYATGAAIALVVVLVRSTLRVMRESRAHEREQVLYEVREMLSDRMRNQVTIVSLSLRSASGASPNEFELAEARACIASVNRMVDELDADALDAWKERYAGSRVLSRFRERGAFVRT